MDDLLGGLYEDDWRVRHEVVDRLIARGKGDPRTLPRLLDAATSDPAFQVQCAILMRLSEFDRRAVLPVLHRAAVELHAEVRWSARFSLNQLGETWDYNDSVE